MTASPRTYPRLRREATDPATPGARLDVLASHRVEEIANLARANPALPAAALRRRLHVGCRAAWSNPATAFLLWGGATPEVQQGAARCLASTSTPPPLVTQVVRDWWASERDPLPMLHHLETAGINECNRTRSHGGPLHRRAIRALCLAIRWELTRGLVGLPHPNHDRFVRNIEAWAFGTAVPLSVPAVSFVYPEGKPDHLDEVGRLLAQTETKSVARGFNVLLLVAATFDKHNATWLLVYLFPDLADLLRAAIPDPTEGLG